MDNIVIELNYRRKDFEEIYFRDGGGKTFLSPRLKGKRNLSIFFAVVFTLTLIYTLLTQRSFGVVLFAGLLFCFSLYEWYSGALPTMRWLKEVRSYLDGLDKTKEHRLLLTDTAFSIVQDKNETIEKWTEFKRAEIEENFVSLTSNTTNYLIPKKSMSEGEYELLRTIAAKKIKNDL